MLTHYAARLLLNGDERFKFHRNRIAQVADLTGANNAIRAAEARQRVNCIDTMVTCIPRSFSIVPFLPIYIARCGRP
jgi:hypothetical protein